MTIIHDKQVDENEEKAKLLYVNLLSLISQFKVIFVDNHVEVIDNTKKPMLASESRRERNNEEQLTTTRQRWLDENKLEFDYTMISLI